MRESLEEQLKRIRDKLPDHQERNTAHPKEQKSEPVPEDPSQRS